MVLKETVTIDAPARRVWPWIAEPQRIGRWNPKAVAVDRGSASPVGLGESFGMTFRMGEREQTMRVEVTHCRVYESLTYRHHDQQNRDRYSEESFTISDHGAGVRLTQRVDLGRAGLPWWASFLMTAFAWFGRPVGKQNLERPKELAEHEN